MAMADAIRQSSLPSIGCLDLDKIKRETLVYNQNMPVSAALNMPAPPLASPTNTYSGPPPPYSFQSTTANSAVGLNAYISPPESRRTSGDEKEPAPPHHQSLPSIHEALGSEQHLSITSLLSKAGPPTTSNPSSQQSSTTLGARSHPNATSIAAPNTAAQAQSPTRASHDSLEKSSRPQFPPYLQLDSGASRFSAINAQEPHHMLTQPSRTAPSPVNAFRQNTQSWPGQQSPTHDQLSRPATHMNSQYAYSPYQPTHSSYAPQTPLPASFEHVPAPHQGWRCAGSEIDRADEMRRTAVKQSPVPQAFGETVKRHLDIFELETSLNEIAEGSGRALEFSRVFGSRAHATQRSGPIPGSLPSLVECDDMIRQQERVLTSMARIREVIIAQQAALAEQRSHEYNHKPGSEMDDDGSMYQEKPDGSGGFAGSDTKKRRGRAAPPGRCHSCNRAETPEWRRGPDGARTLCNACGLHFAKLTRRMGSKASSTGSNLRPKEMDLTSPH